MGETFGKYELIEKVAAGGMAEVFLARQEGELGGFTKEVAIKRLFPNLTEEQEIIDMFLDEGRIAARLNHPNIVQIYDLGMVDDFLYIAMEYVHGRDLRSILERGYNADNFIAIELAASICAQVAAGLHYAHTRTDDDGNPTNIVHRDISPQNVLVSMDGGVKICDFGIAKAEHRIGHTQAGQVKGKWSYMSPEQIETGKVDPRSDVFSLGIVLYEATTMTRLFKSETQFEALENILHGRVKPPTSVRSGYPAELERIVLKSLQREPAHRYQSAEELQLDLENWLVQNQASTSTVHIARYMRNIFPELTQQGAENNDTTGPMSVSEEHFQKVDEDVSRRRKEEEEADPGAATLEETSKDKDVTDMDENDLDAALDMALGATPSEARTTPSPAASQPADEAPAAIEEPSDLADTLDDRPALQREPEPADEAPAGIDAGAVDDTITDEHPPAADAYDADETVVSEPPPEVLEQASSPEPAAEPEPQPAAEPEPEPQPAAEPEPEPQPAAEPEPAPTPSAQPAAQSGTVPAPDSPGLGSEKSEPPPADRSGPPPGGPPPAATSGTVPTGPPGSGPPPSARSQESRARQAFEPEPSAPQPEPIDDLGSPADFKTGSKMGWIAIIGLVGAIGGIFAIYWASLNTEGSHIEQEAEKNRIDPDMLEVKIPDPPPKVMANLTTTPEDSFVVINGLLHQDGPGQIPLVKGETNEVVIFADGYLPERLVVEGKSDDLEVQLQKFENPDPEAVADLNIVTEPRDALVYVDGQQVGTSPTTVTGLTTEHEHHVMIKKEGRYPYAGIIDLVKKSENLVDTRLEKLDSRRKNYVEVIFSAIPRGTLVRVNGEQLGATKSFKPFDRNQMLMVELTEPDSAPMRRYVLLEGVGTMEIRPFLEPMKRERGTISVYVEPMGAQLYVGANAYQQGPAANLEFPEGDVKVVLDTAYGRNETQLEVVPNTHTKYVLTPKKSGEIIVKKKE